MAIVALDDKVILVNGTAINMQNSGTINNRPVQTVTPTTSQQSVSYSSPYTGLEGVTVNAIPSQYIVPTGTKSITSNGTGIDVSSYALADVAVPTGSTINNQDKTVTPTESEQEITYGSGYTGLGTVTVEAISSTYVGSGISRKSSTDLTVSGASITAPAGYYETAASKSVSTMTLPTAASATSSGTSKATISRSTSDQYINISTGYNSTASYYKINAVSNMTLPTAASSTSSGTSKATIGRSTSNQYINIPVGYNSTAAYYTISAVANGSATGPSSLSGTSATVSTGTNTLTLTKTGITTTPTVSAGYVSSATASTATVSLTASVTTKAAATYYPSSSDQTISASQYLTGAQTIKAVTVSGLDASKILSGTTVNIGDSADADRITSVTGNVTFKTYYTGSGTPSSSLGSVGDIYLQTS